MEAQHLALQVDWVDLQKESVDYRHPLVHLDQMQAKDILLEEDVGVDGLVADQDPLMVVLEVLLEQVTFFLDHRWLHNYQELTH